MQFLRLYETCRMICYSLLSNDVNFVEIGLKLDDRDVSVSTLIITVIKLQMHSNINKSIVYTPITALDLHVLFIRKPKL